jgi:chromosome segregation ATPase
MIDGPDKNAIFRKLNDLSDGVARIEERLSATNASRDDHEQRLRLLERTLERLAQVSATRREIDADQNAARRETDAEQNKRIKDLETTVLRREGVLALAAAALTWLLHWALGAITNSPPKPGH